MPVRSDPSVHRDYYTPRAIIACTSNGGEHMERCAVDFDSVGDDGVRLIKTLFTTTRDPAVESNWRNSWTAWWQGSDIAHCEPYFPGTGHSFVIINGKQSALMPGRRYKGGGWTCLETVVTKKQYDIAYNTFADELSGLSFDTFGWIMTILFPFGTCMSNDRITCSRAVAYCYTKVGIIRESDLPYGVDGARPPDIYNALIGLGRHRTRSCVVDAYASATIAAAEQGHGTTVMTDLLHKMDTGEWDGIN